MPSVFVPQIDEFLPLIESERRKNRYAIRETSRGYTVISSETELVFHRKESGFHYAIWYGAFTGGIDGRIAQFDKDVVRVFKE